MNQIKKLVIPAAGWGTRFLPLTKVVYKEMIPILNRPLIDILLEQAFNAGIEEVIIILSKRKKHLINYFKRQGKLEKQLLSQEKYELLEIVQKTNKSEQIKIVFQEKQLGLAHAISLAAKHIKNEPFAVILGDDLITSLNQPVLNQMFEKFALTKSSILCTQLVERKEISRYGIIKINKKIESNFYQINGFIEKPKIKEAPSNLAILGHYIFTPKFMDILSKTKYSRKHETNLQAALDQLILSENVYALSPKNIGWYDLGSIEGFVKATIDYALNNKSIKTEIKKHIHAIKINK